MKKYFLTGLLLISVSQIIFAQPRESLADKVRKAFSLVGHWEIIKMSVLRASDVSNPSTVPEAAVGKVSILVASELGSSGSFTVAPGGAITGDGEVQYQYHVSAGSTAFSFSNITFPVGASANMQRDEDGVRKFTITGMADLTKRTISLNAFKVQGGPLNMIIYPGASKFTSVTWPPMTNVESEVIVTGSSLLLRASGVLSGIKVSFEAVKYVDLVPLFTAIEQLVISVQNNSTSNTNNNNSSTNNNNTNNTNNNNTNNNNNPNNGNNSNNTNNTNNTDTTNNPTNVSNTNNGNNTNNGQGPQPLVAGTVTVEIGGSANVIFRLPQASSYYAVSLTPMNGAGATTVTYSNKTPLGFKVNVAKTGTATGTVKIDWLITPYTN